MRTTFKSKITSPTMINGFVMKHVNRRHTYQINLFKLSVLYCGVLPLLLCCVACFLFTQQSLSKATEISEKSCGKDSPYPKHPSIEQCCTLQGQERKLCLASLRYSADELPSLLEPTNEELCIEFTKNERDYAVR